MKHSRENGDKIGDKKAFSDRQTDWLTDGGRFKGQTDWLTDWQTEADLKDQCWMIK